MSKSDTLKFTDGNRYCPTTFTVSAVGGTVQLKVEGEAPAATYNVSYEEEIELRDFEAVALRDFLIRLYPIEDAQG